MRQSVTTSCTVNSGASNRTEGDAVSTTSGIAGGSIRVDSDVSCVTSRNQVSTSSAVELGAVEAVAPAVEVSMNSRVIACTSLNR